MNLIKKLYHKILFFNAYNKLSDKNDILLIDFDFTLFLHDIGKLKKKKLYTYDESFINFKLINYVKDRYDTHLLYIFTARGLRSIYNVIKIINKIDLSHSGIIALGSTENKIKLLDKLSSKRCILIDDLNDWDFKKNKFKNKKYLIPKGIKYIHPDSINFK